MLPVEPGSNFFFNEQILFCFRAVSSYREICWFKARPCEWVKFPAERSKIGERFNGFLLRTLGYDVVPLAFWSSFKIVYAVFVMNIFCG